MSMMNFFRQVRESAAQRDHRSNWVPANIGAVVDSENIIPSPHGGAWIYVTLTKGDQNGAVSEALCHKITPAWNCPVLLSVNKKGLYIVEEVDPDRYDMWTSGNDGGVLGSHNVAPHHHDDNSSALGQDFVSNRRLADGRVIWRDGDDGAYTVYIAPFYYDDITGADTYWSGGTLDLVDYLTVSTDEWQWIKVGMDRTNHVPIAIAGDATPIGVPLGDSDLADISFSPDLPLAGVLITYNQDIQSQDDITDCSFVKSARVGSGGSGAGNYILIRDEKSSSTNGGTFTSGAWQTRDLNTEVEDTGGDASLSSNQITLAAGTYRCRIEAPAFSVSQHQARLYNISDSTTLIDGTSEYTNGSATNKSFIVGRFTLASSKVLEVQHRCASTKSGDGFGTQAGFGTEIYTVVELIKE